jgi:hypothetical protein
VDFQPNRQMAMLDAPMMKCDRVNLGGSVPVQKR